MSEFHFNKSQRVTVPAEIAGAENVQGVIVWRRGFLGREPEYGVQWSVSDAVAADGTLVVIERAVSESVLLAAQPPQTVSIAVAEKMAEDARQEVTADMLCDIASLATKIDRLERAAKRRQKAKPAARKRSRR